MRVNVYSQEITNETKRIEKIGAQGEVYSAVQLMLHSSDMLHQPPQHMGDEDDRSAITLWLPRAAHRRESLAAALEQMARLVRYAKAEQKDDYHELSVDREALTAEIMATVPSDAEISVLAQAGLVRPGHGVVSSLVWVRERLDVYPTRLLFELRKALLTESVNVSWYTDCVKSEWFQKHLSPI